MGVLAQTEEHMNLRKYKLSRCKLNWIEYHRDPLAGELKYLRVLSAKVKFPSAQNFDILPVLTTVQGDTYLSPITVFLIREC